MMYITEYSIGCTIPEENTCHFVLQELEECSRPEATWTNIKRRIQNCAGIVTCVCYENSGNCLYIHALIKQTKIDFPDLKVCWYSDNENSLIDDDDIVEDLDYIKVGSYNEKFGPITEPTTNQRLYKIWHLQRLISEDITNKFWKRIDETKDKG